MTTEEYAKEYLFREIKEIENSHRLNVLTELTVYEKAIIYKYSEDGYLDLNEKLRLSEGKDISVFGVLLDECLSKLPDYQGITYRGESLTDLELERYRFAFNNNMPLRQHFFCLQVKVGQRLTNGVIRRIEFYWKFLVLVEKK